VTKPHAPLCLSLCRRRVGRAPVSNAARKAVVLGVRGDLPRTPKDGKKKSDYEISLRVVPIINLRCCWVDKLTVCLCKQQQLWRYSDRVYIARSPLDAQRGRPKFHRALWHLPHTIGSLCSIASQLDFEPITISRIGDD